MLNVILDGRSEGRRPGDEMKPPCGSGYGAVLVFALALLTTGTGACNSENPPSREGVAMVRVTSSAFSEGDSIPALYTCEGNDVSPPLKWSGVPAGTKSIALTCTDPDAPRGTFVHWVLFNLPPSIDGLPEGVTPDTVPQGAVNGTNDFPKLGYGGPCPPPGTPHRYYFTVYALDAVLDLPSGARLRDLTAAMEGHILAKGSLMGRYARK